MRGSLEAHFPDRVPTPDRPLRVAITVDPNFPVPPILYGGIERIADFLARGLATRGHQVTLFAHPESNTAGKLVPYGVPPHVGARSRATELAQLGVGLWTRRSEFDLVHSFGRLAALLPILPYRRVGKLQSYQRDAVPWRSVDIATRLAGDSIRFTGCSTSVYSQGPPNVGRWHTVFNGADLSKYDYNPTVAADAPLVFLGRIERIKGVHSAIAIARRSGRRLVIAGNKVTDGPEPDYFEREVAPHLGGDSISYIGPVDDVQKNALLGSAAGFLMPIEWEEAFGIVMAEALACGTPVIGFARGSVPEVVREGVNGFVCRNVDDAVRAVAKLGDLSRAMVRSDCEARFSDHAIVNAYIALYQDLRDAITD